MPVVQPLKILSQLENEMNKEQYLKSTLEDDILYWFVGHTMAGESPNDLYDALYVEGDWGRRKGQVKDALKWEWERYESSENWKNEPTRPNAERLVHAQKQLHNIRANMIHDAMKHIVKEGWCMNLKDLKKEMSKDMRYVQPPRPWK
jgi:hypothetical protein